MNKAILLVSFLVSFAGLLACRGKPAGGAPAAAPTAETFTSGVRAYLERRGDLCVARPRWPVDVPEGARGGPDAVQLPVLERLGVVTSTVIDAREAGVATPFKVRRYRLTAEGRAHYLDRLTRLPAAPEDARAFEHADLCVLRLTLGAVTRWTVASSSAPPSADVSYTYHVDAPAWVRDPSFQKVFPAVARLVAGEGSAELVESFTLTPAGWTSSHLLARAGASAPQASAP